MIDSKIRPPVRILALLAAVVMVASAPTPYLMGAAAGATSEGIHYQTDSGFEVIDASGSDPPDGGTNPFPDDNTLELPDVTLSASGSAEVTLDQRTGDYTNLSGISSSPDITVNPDDKQAVVLKSSLNSLDFASVDFDATNDGVDLVYDAGSTASLTIQGTGLAEGTTVEALDADSGTTLDSADADASGDVTFTALDSGTHNVDLEDISTRPSDDGGRDRNVNSDTTSPTADAGADKTATVDEVVTFDGSGSSDNEGISRYRWNFDSSYSIGATATQSFDSPGEYTVELEVTDDAGNSDTDTVTVTVSESDSADGGEGGDSGDGGDGGDSGDGGDGGDGGDTGDTGGSDDDSSGDTGDGGTDSPDDTGGGSDGTAGGAGGTDDPYTDSGGSENVIPGERGDDGTTSFEISLGDGDDGDGDGSDGTSDDSDSDGDQGTSTGSDGDTSDGERPGSIVLDLRGSGPGDGDDTDSQDQTDGDDGQDQTDGDDGQDQTDGDDGQDQTDGSDSEDDGGQSDSGGDDDDSTPRNVAVDRMVIEPTEDADPEFSITVREWSVDQEELVGTDADATQNSLTDAGAGSPAPGAAAAVAITGGGVDARQTANRSDPRQFLRETGAAAVGYVQVNHTNPETDIENVTFQFRVRKSYLNETSVGPDSIALYRDETDRWNQLDAEQVGENATHYFFEATSPGLSLFTVGSTRPVFDTETAQLDAASVNIGETASVEATVRNLGSVAGTHTVALTADGEEVASQTVDVAAQSDETVTLSFAPEAAGEYSLVVDGQDAGVLTVEQVTTPTATPQGTETRTEGGGQATAQATIEPDDEAESAETVAQTETGSGDEDGGFGGSLLIGLLAAIVVIVLAVVYWRRRDDEDGEKLA